MFRVSMIDSQVTMTWLALNGLPRSSSLLCDDHSTMIKQFVLRVVVQALGRTNRRGSSHMQPCLMRDLWYPCVTVDVG